MSAGHDRRLRRRTKRLVAFADGFRESESWADLLRDCKTPRHAGTVLAVGDGALGIVKALRAVFPTTREQRCWFHVQANVLAALPKSAHPGAKAALAEIFNAEDKEHALKAAKAFEADYGAKWPRAARRSPTTSTPAGVLRLPRRALHRPAQSPDRPDTRCLTLVRGAHTRGQLSGRRRRCCRDGVL